MRGTPLGESRESRPKMNLSCREVASSSVRRGGQTPRNDSKPARDLQCLCEEVVRHGGLLTKQSPFVDDSFSVPLGVNRGMPLDKGSS
jgi:hypothetical protein